MQVDLLYELSCPRPWTADSERNSYREALAQITLADKLGFGTAWEVEHHFLSEFSHSSAPEVFLSAVSQRTNRIRIGHGVVLLPYPFNHPIRVAERIAALDIVSDGRVEFGTGRSSWYEQTGFGINPADSRAMWEEALHMIPRMWATEDYSHEGQYFQVPSRNVHPKPIQDPHPPMWLAATQPDSFEVAGKFGLGVMALLIMVPVEELQRRIGMYRSAIAEAKPAGEFVNEKVNALTFVHCAPTREEAIASGAPQAVAWYLATIGRLLAPPEDQTVYSGVDFVQLAREREAGAGMVQNAATKAIETFFKGEPITPEELLEAMDEQDMIVIGDPEHCRRKLSHYADLGINSVMSQSQVGAISHYDVMQSISLLGEQVVPYFAPR